MVGTNSGRLTFDITGWRGLIAPVRVDGWVGRHVGERPGVCGHGASMVFHTQMSVKAPLASNPQNAVTSVRSGK